MSSHRFGSISKELPGDGVFGDVRAGAVPGLQHRDLAPDHLHLSSGDLHRLSVTWKNNRNALMLRRGIRPRLGLRLSFLRKISEVLGDFAVLMEANQDFQGKKKVGYKRQDSGF